MKQAMDNLDKLKTIEFSSGGFHQGHNIFQIDFRRDPDKADVMCLQLPSDSEEVKKLGTVTRQQVLDLLKDLNIQDWKENYDDNAILDGTQWGFEIGFLDPNILDLKISGSNAYPEKYEQLKEFFYQFLPEKDFELEEEETEEE